MSNALRLIPRQQIDVLAWDACVTASPQRIIYGYAWYLDIVLPSPGWSWVGIVLVDTSGRYQAVMPVPLRRKRVAGIAYKWVVHQPFFCQFLDIFSRDTALDARPFFRLLTDSFRYGSIYNIRQPIADGGCFDAIRPASTHVVYLASGYRATYQQYSPDRKANVRRGRAANWIRLDSSDPEPLLALFRQYHASSIDGGVAEWAYTMLRNLIYELMQRSCGRIQYAARDGCIEAGALFVEEGSRIIYLFNAASDRGRKENARTFLIDQLIQEHAGSEQGASPWVIDFESPEKPSIRTFYQSFGAIEQPFLSVRWNHLHPLEQLASHIHRYVKHVIDTYRQA